MTISTIFINTPPPYLSLAQGEKLPIVMTVAGSDSSGGAGIEADIKTISAHRCYGITCITALTIQTPAKVHGIHATPKDVVSQILDANLSDMQCDVIKTGMLTTAAIDALSDKIDSLGAGRPKMVVDPVLVATSGSPLGGEELVTKMIEKITHLATLLTPNVPECFKLISRKFEVNSLADVYEMAREVSKVTKCSNILVKGGHIPWKNDSVKHITDALYFGDEEKFIVYRGHYVSTNNTHGTGCTLASAIASNIARGYSLPQSVYGAIEYVQNAVAIGCNVTKKNITENGPINHLYAIEIPLKKMIEDECFTAHDVFPDQIAKPFSHKDDFFTYLINHPSVKPHWKTFVNHAFVKEIAQGTIDSKKFQFFIEQDHAYLVDYARFHCIAGSKAPTLENVEKQLMIVGNVREEMKQHEKRLIEVFGVQGEEYFKNISRGPALRAYSRYFYDVSRRGCWEELVASLSPCLMGYGQALINQRKYVKEEEDSVYYEWCNTYNSDIYKSHMEDGRFLLNQIAHSYPADKIETLVTIYGQVCQLETKFWDAALNYGDDVN